MSTTATPVEGKKSGIDSLALDPAVVVIAGVLGALAGVTIPAVQALTPAGILMLAGGAAVLHALMLFITTSARIYVMQVIQKPRWAIVRDAGHEGNVARLFENGRTVSSMGLISIFTMVATGMVLHLFTGVTPNIVLATAAGATLGGLAIGALRLGRVAWFTVNTAIIDNKG